MNKYVKKCLIVYTSLALMLVGMAGAAYAITATDADQYVTRSQYAVDMAHLQNKLDEQEAGLLGTINRYRSTDVKFVTFDTPNKQATSTIYNTGYHNGGNFFPRYSNTSNYAFAFGLYNGNRQNDRKEGRYTTYDMYRLWNGNYYITEGLYYHDNNASNPKQYYPTVNYAVPLESHPGWYLEVKIYTCRRNILEVMASVVKLDPNASGPKPDSGTATVRFKKQFFRYCGNNVTAITNTRVTAAVGASVYRNRTYNQPFTQMTPSGSAESQSFSQTITFTTYLDPETGDYMMDFANFPISSVSDSGADVYNQTIYCSADITMNRVIPNDNVEYVCGPTGGNVFIAGNGTYNCPEAATIGTGLRSDPWWEYEFVDCENGIKYWHAYRRPRLTNDVGAAAGLPLPYGIHLSLPIVY